MSAKSLTRPSVGEAGGRVSKTAQAGALLAAIIGASASDVPVSNGRTGDNGQANSIAKPDASSGESRRRASGPPVGEEVV